VVCPKGKAGKRTQPPLSKKKARKPSEKRKGGGVREVFSLEGGVGIEVPVERG